MPSSNSVGGHPRPVARRTAGGARRCGPGGPPKPMHPDPAPLPGDGGQPDRHRRSGHRRQERPGCPTPADRRPRPVRPTSVGTGRGPPAVGQAGGPVDRSGGHPLAESSGVSPSPDRLPLPAPTPMRRPLAGVLGRPAPVTSGAAARPRSTGPGGHQVAVVDEHLAVGLGLRGQRPAHAPPRPRPAARVHRERTSVPADLAADVGRSRCRRTSEPRSARGGADDPGAAGGQVDHPDQVALHDTRDLHRDPVVVSELVATGHPPQAAPTRSSSQSRRPGPPPRPPHGAEAGRRARPAPGSAVRRPPPVPRPGPAPVGAARRHPTPRRRCRPSGSPGSWSGWGGAADRRPG